jgi:DNA-binding transcriptional regulator YiaG
MTAARGADLPDTDERAALLLAADILDRLPAMIAGTRRARGLSQEAVAEHLGVSLATVRRWESGARFPQGQAAVAVLRWITQPTGEARP